MGTKIIIPSSVDEDGDIIVLAVDDDGSGHDEQILIKES